MLTLFFITSVALVLVTAHDIMGRMELKREQKKCRKVDSQLTSVANKYLESEKELKELQKFVSEANLLEQAEQRRLMEPKSSVSKLIESIKDMEVTGVTAESHSEKYDKNFIGFKPLVTLELNRGVVKLIDLAQSGANSHSWLIDLVYNGAPLTRLTEQHREELGAIFMEKMAEAAIRDTSNKLLSEYSGGEDVDA